jgi:prepilin-type N-terminal cleavage/methylation domain-containing protein
MRLTAGSGLRDDRGFTLTEVLITIVILGVIILPLGNAVIGFIRLTDDTSTRLSESHDVQLAVAYFAQDVNGLGTRDWSGYPYRPRRSVELNAPATGGLYPCGPGGTPAAVLRLAWDDPESVAAAPTITRASYVVVTAGGEHTLHRMVCAGSATVVSDIVVIHNLDPAATPVVVCQPPCATVPVPASITLTLAIKAPGNTGAATALILSGQRRQT